MKSALILYPHQLFAVEYLPQVSTVYLVEEPLIFGTDDKYPLAVHKAKLVLLRASMQRYAEEVLWPAGYEVEYIEFADDVTSFTAPSRAYFAGVERLYIFDPVDDILTKRIHQSIESEKDKVTLEILDSPNFYLKQGDVAKHFKGKETYKFADFYQWQRERFNILIDDNYGPFGGKWSFDKENRKKLPKDVQLPGMTSYGSNKYVDDAIVYVEAKFPNNPGSYGNFIWPTNHEEARSWLEEFYKTRLSNFGPYEDAIDTRGIWLYHSAITPMLNIGLLNPQEVVEGAMEYATRADIPLESLEGFIRQVLGWREYVRCMYVLQGSKMRTKNALANHRKLTKHWYEATTGIPPVDDVIQKARDFGYAHHIERLMIMGNIMLISDIHPDEVYKWFMSFFIDAYDWVMVPNVYGMSQYADGGTMTTKPYMSASNYIFSMSDSYQKGPWSDIWDGLFWRFVDTHRLMLKKNPRLGGVLVKRYDTMDEARKRIIGYRAQDFLDEFTTEQ